MLRNIHTETGYFLCHCLFLPFSPAFHHAGLINPDDFQDFIGDSSMAATLTHGLVRPKVNRSATPSLRQAFYHIFWDTSSLNGQSDLSPKRNTTPAIFYILFLGRLITLTRY
jgi:hypothetical protein